MAASRISRVQLPHQESGFRAGDLEAARLVSDKEWAADAGESPATYSGESPGTITSAPAWMDTLGTMQKTET